MADQKCEEFHDCDILNVVVIDRMEHKKRMDDRRVAGLISEY